MGFMVQIEESKIDKLAAYAEKMLKFGGKLMQCIEEMDETSGMGHRGGSGMSNRYNERGGGSMGERGGYGNREDWEDPEIAEIIQERRRRRSGR